MGKVDGPSEPEQPEHPSSLDACKAAVERYWAALEIGGDASSACFAVDGSFEVSGDPSSKVVGRAALADFLSGAAGTKINFTASNWVLDADGSLHVDVVADGTPLKDIFTFEPGTTLFKTMTVFL